MDFSAVRLRRARDAFSDNFIPNSSRLQTFGNENRGPITYKDQSYIQSMRIIHDFTWCF